MSRVDEIRNRLEAIAPWKWDATAHDKFLAAAPEDISYLLGRVEKLEGLLNRLAEFADGWSSSSGQKLASEARTLLADESKDNEHGL